MVSPAQILAAIDRISPDIEELKGRREAAKKKPLTRPPTLGEQKLRAEKVQQARDQEKEKGRDFDMADRFARMIGKQFDERLSTSQFDETPDGQELIRLEARMAALQQRLQELQTGGDK